MSIKKMVRANAQTRHFEFDAYGETEEDAYAALRNAWNDKHRKQYPAALDFEDVFEDGDICYFDVELGGVYRDRERIN